MVKKFLLFFLLGIFLFFILKFGAGDEEKLCDRNYFLLELKYSLGNFELINKSIQEGCAPDAKGNFEYRYSLVNNQTIIYFGKFNSNVLFLDDFSDGEMQGGVELIEEQKVFLIIPYAPEADDLQIFKQDEKIFETKIYDAGAISCKIK